MQNQEFNSAWTKAQTTENLKQMQVEAKEKLNKLNMDLKKAEARVSIMKKRIRQENRTRDTRKKIIIGAAFLKAMDQDNDFRIMTWDTVEKCISEKDRAYLGQQA